MLALVLVGVLIAIFWFGVKVLWVFAIAAVFLAPWIIRFLKFFYMVYVDLYRAVRSPKVFREYGVTIYCGRQGAGKTMAMTEYLERMRKQYPKCLIMTNYGYKYEHAAIEGWNDLVDVKNGNDGVIFAFDEIQNEFDSTAWKSFPPQLLREITQQRKQRIKIIMSSQVFTRVVKQIREQCFEVVECSTLLGRWTWLRAYDAEDYNSIIDRPEVKLKLRRLWRYNFLQTDYIRGLYDSYEKIEKIKSLYDIKGKSA